MTVLIAKAPNLKFLSPFNGGTNSIRPLPLIVSNDGAFNWDANAFLTEFGGGPEQYGRKPVVSTVLKRAYSLNLFCGFLESESIDATSVTDSHFYKYIEFLKPREIGGDTTLSHGRIALRYLLFLQRRHPELLLITKDADALRHFQVHYSHTTLIKHGRAIDLLDHHAFNGLIRLTTEAEYIRDHEVEMWFDAITSSSYHPAPSKFISNRWLALGTLLDITGSRITEVGSITRSMIKNAYVPIAGPDAKVVIRGVPVLKGKYKGQKRNIETSLECLQIIFEHIVEVELTFKHLDHDAIFVNVDTGSALSPVYLKNYAKKVINGSPYKDRLAHVSNHSFRHRFITLTIARELRELGKDGNFLNILTVAATAVRKITLHASNATLAAYVHFAIEINRSQSQQDLPTPSRLKIREMKTLAKSLSGASANRELVVQQIVRILDSM